MKSNKIESKTSISSRINSSKQILLWKKVNAISRTGKLSVCEHTEVLHGWTRVKKRGPSCEMPSVARRLVVRPGWQNWRGAWYKRVYMWFLIIRGSRDVWIWWSQPSHYQFDALHKIVFLQLFALDSCTKILSGLLWASCWCIVGGWWRGWLGHPCGVLRRITDYRLTATAAQITGSPPLLRRLQAHRSCCLTWIFCVKWNMKEQGIFFAPCLELCLANVTFLRLVRPLQHHRTLFSWEDANSQ